MANVKGTGAPTLSGTAFTGTGPTAFYANVTSTANGSMTHVRWYSANAANTATAARVRVWDVTASVLVPANETTVTINTAVGWHDYALSTPVPVVAGQTYQIAVIWDTGTITYGALSGAGGSLPIVNGSLSITALGYRDGAGHDGYSASPVNGADYQVDAEITGSSALDISVGADQTITSDQVANVVGSATGGTGTKTYAWTKTSGPAGTFGSTTSASTTFTPTGGVGAAVLRCTVTDSSGSDFDELTLTVTAPPTAAVYSGTTANPTWTPYGGAVPGVLSDANTTTGVFSTTNPVGAIYDDVLTTLEQPGVADDLTLTLGAWRDGGSTGTITARLYEGATLRSTSTARTLPTTASGSITVVFPAADLAAIAPASWTSGLRLTLTATAS